MTGALYSRDLTVPAHHNLGGDDGQHTRGGLAMQYDDLPESSNIEDRRGEGPTGGGGFGGIPGGAGGLSIGTVVVLGLIGWALGIDPSFLIGGAEILTREQPRTS